MHDLEPGKKRTSEISSDKAENITFVPLDARPLPRRGRLPIWIYAALGSLFLILLATSITMLPRLGSTTASQANKPVKIPPAVPTPTPTLEEIPATSNVSITATANRIYAGTADGTISALDATNGKVLWSVKRKGACDGKPLVVDTTLYVVCRTNSSTIMALSTTNGEQRWEYNVSSNYLPELIVDNNVLYTVSPSALIALSTTNGAALWQAKSDNGDGTQAPLVHNGIVYAQEKHGNQAMLTAFQGANGKKLWSYKAVGQGVSTPQLHQDTLYVTTWGEQGGPSILHALRAQNGTEIWQKSKLDASFFSSMLFDKENLYVIGTNIILPGTPTPAAKAALPGVSTGLLSITMPLSIHKESFSTLYAFRASDGTQLWQVQLNAGKPGWLGGVFLDRGIIYTNVNGRSSADSQLLAVNAADGRLRWNQHLLEEVRLLSITQGVLYMSGVNRPLTALRGVDGMELWQQNRVGQSYEAPMLVGDTLYLGGNLQKVYALNVKSGKIQWQTFLFRG